jgi:hypothetical protein
MIKMELKVIRINYSFQANPQAHIHFFRKFQFYIYCMPFFFTSGNFISLRNKLANYSFYIGRDIRYFN